MKKKVLEKANNVPKQINTFLKSNSNQEQQYMSLDSALGRQRQGDLSELKTSLLYIGSSRPNKDTQ